MKHIASLISIEQQEWVKSGSNISHYFVLLINQQCNKNGNIREIMYCSFEGLLISSSNISKILLR